MMTNCHLLLLIELIQEDDDHQVEDHLNQNKKKRQILYRFFLMRFLDIRVLEFSIRDLNNFNAS